MALPESLPQTRVALGQPGIFSFDGMRGGRGSARQDLPAEAGKNALFFLALPNS